MTDVMGMTGPTPIATTVGVLMLLGALVALLRVIGGLRNGARAAARTDLSIDICHGIMGLSMAGMLIPSLEIVTVGPSLWAWLVVQSLVTLWFIVSTVGEFARATGGLRARLAALHHLPHIALSGAMVYMLVVMQVMSPQISGMHHDGSSMSMMVSITTLPLPTLDLLLAFFLVGYTVLLVDRLPFAAARKDVFAPRSAAGLGILMASAMSYMLVMMFV